MHALAACRHSAVSTPSNSALASPHTLTHNLFTLDVSHPSYCCAHTHTHQQTTRPLLSRDQLLRGVELVEGADYAALVISSSSSDSNGAQASACTVLYANQAARDVFSLQQQPPQQLHQLTGLPAAVADMLHSLHSQQVPSAAAGHSSQQQQQHFSVLHNVDWPCSGAANSQQQQQQLCIPQLLCVPLVSPNGEECKA